MRHAAAVALVFVAGFIVMVLEIVGARFLAKDFGSSFHVWVSQIGVVLVALAAGYYLGGLLADRWPGVSWLAWPLGLTGAMLWCIPVFAPRLIELIVLRHPAERDIPPLWQKLDPVMGSALIFLLPSLVLAALSPYMIRRAARHLGEVGRSSGRVIAAGTLGSITGVFVSGFVLIDHLRLSQIFQVMGGLTGLLGVLCLLMDGRLSGKRGPGVQSSEGHE